MKTIEEKFEDRASEIAEDTYVEEHDDTGQPCSGTSWSTPIDHARKGSPDIRPTVSRACESSRAAAWWGMANRGFRLSATVGNG